MSDSAAYNLDFRPDSYWSPENAQQAILANMKGDLRREMIRDLLAQGISIEDELLEENTSRETRALLERADFRWMGGEYLPDHAPGEVEIARLTMASVTQDVYSIRARRKGGAIHYRIVDEYAMEWSWSPESSEHPLSFRELIHLIDNAELYGEGPPDFTDTFRDGQLNQGMEPDQAAGWVTVTSEFYPDLRAYYQDKADAWLERQPRFVPDEDEEGEGLDEERDFDEDT